jgi:quercetin dioxygenase-like cupin family protein
LKQTVGTVLAVAVVGFVVGIGAQQPAFKRTMVQQGDISVPGREAVTAVVDFEPGAKAAPHTHPGEEVGFVIEGKLLVEQEGKPAQTVEAGHAFLIAAGAVHSATNTATGATKIVSTYIVEKGKPLATPVAAPAK